MGRPKLYQWDATLLNHVQALTLPADGEGTVDGARHAAMRAARARGCKVVVAATKLEDRSRVPADEVATRVDAVFYDPRDGNRAQAKRMLGVLDPEPARGSGSRELEDQRSTAGTLRREIVCPTCKSASPTPDMRRCYACDPVGQIHCGVCGSPMQEVTSDELLWLAGSRELARQATRLGFSVNDPADLRRVAETMVARAEAIEAGADPGILTWPRFEHGPAMGELMTAMTGVPVRLPDDTEPAREAEPPRSWTEVTPEETDDPQIRAILERNEERQRTQVDWAKWTDDTSPVSADDAEAWS